MKSILFVAMATAMLSAGIGTAKATEPDENVVEYVSADSTEAAVDSVLNSRSLGEVTVKGTRATVIKDGVSYIPSKKEKKYSMDPFILLKNMGITSLVVNGSKVSNHINDEASFFIDGREAGVADVRILLPKDVERVLVLESPGDAKYLGAKLVIDYITRKPVFGGYVNVSGNQTFINDGGNYSLSGKFFNGKSTFQILGETGYFSNRGNYGVAEEKYDLSSGGGQNPLVIDRITTLDDNDHKKISGAVGFSWMYNRSDSCWMRLNGGVDIQDTPHADSWGYNTNADGSVVPYSTEANYKYISPYLYFIWTKKFRRGSQFYIKTTLNGSFNRQENFYNQNKVLDVYNKSQESGFAPHIKMNYYVPFGHNNSLQATLYLDESFYRVKYTGSANETVNNREGKYELDLSYRQAFTFGQNSFSFSFDTELPVRHYKAGDLPDKTDFTYSNSLSMWLSVGSKHRLGSLARVWRQSINLGQMVDVDIKEDDISGTRGNDQQISPTRYQLSLSYMFLPLRWLAFTVGSYYDHEANSFVTRYDAIGDVVYSSTVNSGVRSSLAFYWSGSVKLLDNSLNISPRIFVTHYYHNGLLEYDYWGVKPSISVTYFSDKGFWGSVSYSPPAPKEQYWGGSIIGKSHSHNFSIQAGYTIGNFSCDISICPLYRYGRYEQITNLPGVNIVNNSYSKSMGRSISLSLKYVIDFGRKYPHGNDMYIESERVSSVR